MHTPWFKYKSHLFLVLIILSLASVACHPLNYGPSSTESTIDGIDSAAVRENQTFGLMFQRTGCGDFKDYVWNYIYQLISMGDDIAYFENFEERIKQRVRESLEQSPTIPQENIASFAEYFAEIYTLMSNFKKDHQDRDDIISSLIQIKYGDTSGNLKNFIEKLKATLNNLDTAAKALNKNCPEELPSYLPKTDFTQEYQWNIEWFHTMKRRNHPVVYGAKKVMAIAYQSCNSLDLSLMPKNYITQGIKGNKYSRTIVNTNAVKESHYYLSQIQIPNRQQCINIKSFPVLYDFGGKPSTTIHSMNLFKDHGGASILGLDCSGFVTTALASAGLRLGFNVPLVPRDIHEINTWFLKEPKRKNFSCLIKQNITSENPIQPGDIITSNGHVIIIDEVRTDPFSLNSITNFEQCHFQQMRDEQFQFSIIQSSAINNAVGINRMKFSESAFFMGSLKTGLQKTASRICYKKFGQIRHQNISEISVLRHNVHEPKCRQPEIHLKNQECLLFCTPQSI